MDNATITLPIEKIVENDFLKALEEHEIKKDILVQQKNDCLALTITDLTDKEKYTLVRQTRLNQKAKRIVIEKVCKAGRESAVLAQKAWIGLEKEFTSIISEGEKHLQQQEDIWDAEEERKKNEKKVLEEKQFAERSNILQNYGAKLIDGFFVLNDVSYEAILIRETEQNIWEEMMMPKYKSIFDENEKTRLANEKKLAQLEQMRTTVYKARYSALLSPVPSISDDDLIDMSDEEFETFKTTHNNAINFENERKAIEDANRQLASTRKSELFSLGLKFNGKDYSIEDAVFSIAPENILVDEAAWNEAISLIKGNIVELNNRKEAEKQKQQERAQELANKKADAKYRRNLMLGFGVDNTEEYYLDIDTIAWGRMAGDAESAFKKKLQDEAAEKQRAQAELDKQQQLEDEAKMKDKPRWEAFVASLEGLQKPQFTTKKYNALYDAALVKLNEIKAFKY